MWLNGVSVPTLVEFSEDYIDAIFGQRQSAIFLFLSNEDSQSDFFKTFSAAAQELKGQIIFVVSGVTEGIQARLAEFIGVDERQVPTIRIVNAADMRKYDYTGSITKMTVESLRSFIGDYKAGRLQPFLKS